MIDEGEGSYCMADCTGYKHEPSLYIRTCCNNNNLGQAFSIKKNGITQYIFCPIIYPKSCPKGTAIIVEVFNSCIIDCKDWYNNGSTTSGVYTVNPDGGTPFTVSYYRIAGIFCQSLISFFVLIPCGMNIFQMKKRHSLNATCTKWLLRMKIKLTKLSSLC